jgi:hypothetical protein
MKNLMNVLTCVLLLTVLLGCENPIPTVITNINTNTNTLNGGTASTDPTLTGCTAAEQDPIRVDITAPLTVAVGGSGGIDATPKSASGKRSDECNISQGIFWGASPTDVCSVPQPSQFTTVMQCSKTGSCQLTATVPGKGASGVVTVACQ